MRQALITAAVFFALAPALAPRAPGRQGASRDVSARRDFMVRLDGGDEVELYEGSHALVIGVSAYTNGWSPLAGVADDVPAVTKVLEENGFQVTTLSGPSTTSRGIRSAIEEFIENYGYNPHDRLLIYFAGHGHTGKTALGERDIGYIIPADAPLPEADDRVFRQRAISMEKMSEYARQIEAKHALFVFDSCFSGSLLSSLRGGVPPGITAVTSLPTRQFITAGSEQQAVPDKSVFRRYFVAGLSGGADINGDGYVTGVELFLYLQQHVTAERKEAQTPQYGVIDDARINRGDIVFALPRPAATPARPARPEPVDPSARELIIWATVKDSGDPEEYKIYLEQYPNGQFAALARQRLARARASAGPPPRPASERLAAARRGVLKLDFDSVDGKRQVPADDYLNSAGITVEGVTEGSKIVILDLSTFYGGQAMRASSGANGLAQVDVNDPVVFTLKFPFPVGAVRFTRPKLLAATESGVTFPEWSARALGATGEVLDSTGEGLGRYFSDVPPRDFVLNGPGITAVRFSSKNYHFAAFSAVVLDDLMLVLSGP